MLGKPSGVLNSKGQISRSGLLRQQKDVASLGASGGPGFSTGSMQGIVPNPDANEECWMVVDDNDGMFGHSWHEVQMCFPPNARKMEEARRGTIPAVDGGSGSGAGKYDQTAYSFNHINYDPGTVLLIKRVNPVAWAIIDAQIGPQGSGSGSGVPPEGSGSGAGTRVVTDVRCVNGEIVVTYGTLTGAGVN